MDDSPQRKISRGIAAAAILIPIMVILLWDIETGVFLLLIGLLIARRVIILARSDDPQLLSDSDRMKMDRHQSERSRTILVQVVDDNGYDLPPAIVEQRMKEAQTKAGPRDTVIPVRHKVT